MARTAEPASRSPGRDHPRRVLLVEDNPGDAGFITGLLASAPHAERYEVSVVGSVQARSTMLTNRPDVVLLDLPVPDTGSLDHLTQLHRAAPDVPIVVVPGSYSDDLERRLLALGARDVLPKTHLGMVAHAVSAMLARALDGAIEVNELARSGHRDGDDIQQLVDASPDGVVVVDRGGVVLLCNTNAARLLARHPDELRGNRFHHPYRRGQSTDLAMRDAGGREHTIELLATAVTWGGDDADVLYLRDKTEQLEREHRLSQEAMHDALTGLPNRELFVDRIDQLIHLAGRDATHTFAVALIDLDRFKLVNESHGHAAGDEVLRVVASRILSAIRPGDSAARVGGDEFGVLITDLRDPDEAQVVAERIHDSLSRPYEIDDTEVFCTISVGLAYHVPDCREPATMLRYADTAMYLGKVEGQGRVAVFDQQMHDKRVHWLHVQSALRTAVEEHQLVLLYQPVFDLTTDQPVGLEALVRWEHPDDGLITPDEFLDVAEESGLIVPLGEWVVAEVCRQIVEWRADNPDYEVPPVAINVSGRQLAHPDFVRSIDQALADNGLDGATLQIDISEAALLENARRAALVLDEITSRGIRIDLDDFGTGLSSLGHLQQFPISSLKIDRSFVTRLTDDTESDELVTAIIALGRALGLWVVAKGVETPEQRSRLYRLGCHLAQGYLFARPLLPLETARFFLRREGGASRRGPLLR